MKKRFGVKMAAIALAAATVVPVAAGCGGTGGSETLDVKKLDPTAVMQEVQTNMSNVDAMDMNMTMALNITSPMLGEEAMGISMDMNMIMDKDPAQMYLDSKVAVTGSEDVSTKMYIVPDGDGYACYMGEENSTTSAYTWQKNLVSGDNAKELEAALNGDQESMSQMDQLNDMMQNAMKLEITGLETVNGTTSIVVDGELNMVDAMSAMSTVSGEGMVSDLDGMEAMFDGVTVPVTYYIDSVDRTLVKCDIDMKAMMDNVLVLAMAMYVDTDGTAGTADIEDFDMSSIDMSSLIQVNEAELSLTINALNDEVAAVTVPADVIAQATENLDYELDVEDIPMLNGTMIGI